MGDTFWYLARSYVSTDVGTCGRFCDFPEWSLEVGGWTIHDRNCVHLPLEIGNWPLCGIAVQVLNHIQTWYVLGGQSGEVCVHWLSCIMISAA